MYTHFFVQNSSKTIPLGCHIPVYMGYIKDHSPYPGSIHHLYLIPLTNPIQSSPFLQVFIWNQFTNSSPLIWLTGGSLCAVSVHRNLICSGYSSGAVVIWQGDDENISSYRELMTTADTQGHKPQVTSTAIHSTLCAAGYDNGNTSTLNRWISIYLNSCLASRLRGIKQQKNYIELPLKPHS